MLKEASKYLIPAALMLAVAACSGNDADKTAADSIVAEAAAALDRGDFTVAESLLDSLNATYPKQIEAGRAALALRPKVMARKTEQEIAELQTLMQYTGAYVDSLGQMFTAVGRSEDVYEPYLIHKDVPADWRNRNTAVARLTNTGDFYVISSLAGHTTGHTALQLTAPDGRSVTTAGNVANTAAADRLLRESLRFPAAMADTLGAFALTIDGTTATLGFIGGKKAPAAKLSAKEVHAFADTYRMGRAMQTVNSGMKRLEQLKAKLQLARDQAARTQQ